MLSVTADSFKIIVFIPVEAQPPVDDTFYSNKGYYNKHHLLIVPKFPFGDLKVRQMHCTNCCLHSMCCFSCAPVSCK